MSREAMDDLAGYYDRVVHFIETFGFRRDEARDIAQDVFARVSKHEEQYRGTSKWKFLETTARYEAFNAIRKKKAQKRDVPEVAIDDLPHLSDSVTRDLWTGREPLTQEEEVIEREQAEIRAKRLAAAIGELEQITRICLIHWLAGRKYREIATLMGLTINAVKSRLHEVRTELRERLHEDPDGIRFPTSDTEHDDEQE
jgi:RNA polymerase sigma factor (sigma-70 family)